MAIAMLFRLATFKINFLDFIMEWTLINAKNKVMYDLKVFTVMDITVTKVLVVIDAIDLTFVLDFDKEEKDQPNFKLILELNNLFGLIFNLCLLLHYLIIRFDFSR
mmetsp:Transcript_65503/g.98798  ORF Transcript_65503/g.98798 Transcript_65503/m.98798 type:complete len:106 (+) Transcript_65503:665-982(+)